MNQLLFERIAIGSYLNLPIIKQTKQVTKKSVNAYSNIAKIVFFFLNILFFLLKNKYLNIIYRVVILIKLIEPNKNQFEDINKGNSNKGNFSNNESVNVII